MHGYIGQPETTHDRKHIRIIFSCGYVIHNKIAYQIVNPADDICPICIYGDAGIRIGRAHRFQDRFEPAPFFLRADRNRTGAGRACSDVYYRGTLFKHLPYAAYSLLYCSATARSEIRVVGQIDDAHYVYMTVFVHMWCKFNQSFHYICRINQRNAMLVVLEGLDGAGKSTQVKKLRTYLESLFGSLEYIHFPRYNAPVYGDLISRFLRGDFGSNETVHPQLVALLFAEDRHGAAPSMKQILENGGHVLLDRYVYSNIAYQCAKLSDPKEAEDLREWIFNTEYGRFELPKPDLNIFLDVPIGFVESKLRSQRGGADRDYLEGGQDIHEADIEFQKRVRAIYQRQCEIDPRFIRIDCSDEYGQMLPPGEIFAKVKAVVDDAIK